jgi:cytochrome b subunit of formate dehydrogenase
MNSNIPQVIDRFDLSARIQHIILFTSFLLLAFTGWGLKYAYQEPASAWISFWGGAKMAGIIHRVAGITMLLDFIYHQFYLVNQARKGGFRLSLVPMPKDVIDAVHNFMYFFGLRKEKPYFAKFNYMQKFDYWAVYWGMVIIGASGFFSDLPGDRIVDLPDVVGPVDLGRPVHHAQRRGAPCHRVHPHLPLLQRTPAPRCVPHELDVAYRKDDDRSVEAPSSGGV